MSSWNAKIQSAQPQPGGVLNFNVNYYDDKDAGFLTTLASQSFSIDSQTSQESLDAQIIDAGMAFRKAYNKKDTYTGRVINIP